jgi:hypothetical protein
MTFIKLAECGYAECCLFMQIVIYAGCHKSYLYAECHYGECHYSGCCYAECHSVECRHAKCRSVERKKNKVLELNLQI